MDMYVGKFCELEYDAPREHWLRPVKKATWARGEQGWNDDGHHPWKVYGRLTLLLEGGAPISELHPIASHSHWIDQTI